MPKVCFRGVTGFDGLYFESCATQCMLVYHLNLTSTHTCKEHCCKRKVAILRYEQLCVRLRVKRSTLSPMRRFHSSGAYSADEGGILCGIDTGASRPSI